MGVANQASIALENAKLYRDTRGAGQEGPRPGTWPRQVQTSFLPASLPEVPGYEFFAHYEPAQEVGGDYYGFMPLGPTRLAISVGDVAGKGVAAALLMAKLSSDVRYCLLTEPELTKAVSKLNDLVYLSAGQMDRFITLAGAVLDAGEHVVSMVNAGHVMPMLYRAATGVLEDAMPQGGRRPADGHHGRPDLRGAAGAAGPGRLPAAVQRRRARRGEPAGRRSSA